MNVTTQEAASFLQSQKEKYLQFLKDEHGITTTYEYLTHVGKLGDFDGPDQLSELDELNFPLESFYQVAPMRQQKVMYASLNPGMQSNLGLSAFQGRGEYSRLAETNGDIEELTWNIAANADGYLTSTTGAKWIIESMQESLNPVAAQVSYEEYVDVKSKSEFKNCFFHDVYLSRVFKFPSEKKTDLDSADLEFGRKTFAEEIEFVAPKLLVCGSRAAWMSVFADVVTEPNAEIEAHNESTVSDNYGYSETSARDGVFYLPERDMWVITVAHESRPQFIKTDRLMQNLEYANQRIAW